MTADDRPESGLADPVEIHAVRVEIEGLLAAQRQLNEQMSQSGQIGRQFGRALTGAFLDIAAHGKSLGDVLRSLALSLSQIVLRAAFRPIEGLIGGAFQSMIGVPSPFAASGELAAPASLVGLGARSTAQGTGVTAAASPASAAAGAARALQPIVFNITTPDPDSFRRSEAQIAAMLARAVGQGQRNL